MRGWSRAWFEKKGNIEAKSTEKFCFEVEQDQFLMESHIVAFSPGFVIIGKVMKTDFSKSFPRCLR
jgi:hypothetical protein